MAGPALARALRQAGEFAKWDRLSPAWRQSILLRPRARRLDIVATNGHVIAVIPVAAPGLRALSATDPRAYGPLLSRAMAELLARLATGAPRVHLRLALDGCGPRRAGRGCGLHLACRTRSGIPTTRRCWSPGAILD